MTSDSASCSAGQSGLFAQLAESFAQRAYAPHGR